MGLTDGPAAPRAAPARNGAAADGAPVLVLVGRGWSLASKDTDWVSEGHHFLAEWVDDESSRRMATVVLVTDGEIPGATAARLLAHLRAGR